MFKRRDRADPDGTDDFSVFVRQATPGLLRAAYLLTGDQHLAQDLVQTALARTHVAWRRLRDTGHAAAYTRRVMYHEQASTWRRRRVPESLPGDLPERGLGDHQGNTALRLTLQQALMRLTARQRAILVLRYFEDRSVEETADLLEIAVGSVKSQTNNALARLRKIAPELAQLTVEGSH